MRYIFSFPFIVTTVNLLLTKTGALNVKQYESTALDILLNSGGDIVHELADPPTNSFSSIQYHFFSRSNRNNACITEPTSEDFDCCPFDPSHKTKILVHGFNTTLASENSFEQIKDNLLELDNYNIFIVNWTAYARPPYSLTVVNTELVGHKLEEMIDFIMNHTGALPGDFHLIGHSLGAHICGIAGRKIPHLGRITGLDPAGPMFEVQVHTVSVNRLQSTDANFVDCIHTSSMLAGGFGLPDPICWVDFYPNGGNLQPTCHKGRHYVGKDGKNIKITSQLDVVICNHEISIQYFKYSVKDCNFLARQCDSYSSYTSRKCQSNQSDRMGLYAQKIPWLDPPTMFYLKTRLSEPFCKEGQ